MGSEEVKIQDIEENIQLKDLDNYKEQYENSLKKSSSIFKFIEFRTDIAKEIELGFILKFSKVIDRPKSLKVILEHLEDLEKTIELEAGIFEFSLVYTKLKNLPENLIVSIYLDKLKDILHNIDKISSGNNKYLKKNILNGNLDPIEVPFLSPQEIHPKCWEDIEKKRKLREYKKNNMAATDLYKCYKCGESKCKITQLQTRSADEPITNFITCLVCANTFKQ